MQVEEIMSSPAVTVEVETSLHDAIGTMLEHRIGCVVVVETGVAGILTRSDVLRAAYYVGDSLGEIPVTRAMSSPVVTGTSTRTIRSALGTMQNRNVKKLPVVDEMELVGIVTMTDVARHLPSSVREARERIDRSDDWTD